MTKMTMSLGLGVALLLGNPANAASLQKGNLANRQELNFDASWKFFLGDDSLASRTIYADAKWRTLALPHDWSIEQDIDRNALAGNDGDVAGEHSMYGRIESRWECKNGGTDYAFAIPANTSATVILPAKSFGNARMNGKRVNKRQTHAVFDKEKKLVKMELVSGKYEFQIDNE